VRIYFDTGVFIDFLSVRGNMGGLLRASARRGRAPAKIAEDAELLFKKTARSHLSGTSCLTFYEVEEALYRSLTRSTRTVSRADVFLIPAARSMTTQVQIMIEMFNISVLDLTAATVRLQLQHLELQTRGIRSADALHAATAVAFDADLLVSTDQALLQLDGMLANNRGRILCRDTDSAIKLL
jgi:predicted nucleic acid-binding protein